MSSPTLPAPSPRATRRGFTLIEVMIAVVVLSVGVLAAFAMQIISVQSNAQAKQSTEAVTLADHFIERLRQDATGWLSNAPANFTSTTHIGPAMLNPNTWRLATATGPVNSLGVSGAASPSGPLRNQAQFCIAYRVNWAVQNLVISGYVRIFWHQRTVPQAIVNVCGVGAGLTLNDIDDPSKQAAVLKNIGLYTVPFTLRITPETPF